MILDIKQLDKIDFLDKTGQKQVLKVQTRNLLYDEVVDF